MVVDDRPTTVAAPTNGSIRSTSIALRIEEVPAADAANRPLTDDHVFLIGRPSLRQFISFVKSLSVDGARADNRALADQWRSGRDEVARREREQAGLADDPPIQPLPPHLEPLRAACLADPIYQNAFDVVPTEIAWVELDRLVVYQKHIDLGFVKELQGRLGSQPSSEAIFRTCIPYDHPSPPVKWLRSQPNTYVFASPSNDLRFLGSMLLEPRQVIDQPPPGNLAAVIGLGVGFGSNFLNAVHADNRLVLNNGSHRAFALRDIGITHAPCIIQQVSSREELRAIASSDLRRNPDLYLRQPRPSILRDYFEPSLRCVIPCIRRVHQVRVRFSIDNDEVPAL